MAKKKPEATETTEVDAQIEEKVAQIEKLFKELEKLAAKSGTPTRYPRPDCVGYLPKEWVKRVQKLQAKEATESLTPEEETELQDMYDSVPYPNGLDGDIQAGPVWAPSTC